MLLFFFAIFFSSFLVVPHFCFFFYFLNITEHWNQYPKSPTCGVKNHNLLNTTTHCLFFLTLSHSHTHSVAYASLRKRGGLWQYLSWSEKMEEGKKQKNNFTHKKQLKKVLQKQTSKHSQQTTRTWLIPQIVTAQSPDKAKQLNMKSFQAGSQHRRLTAQ